MSKDIVLDMIKTGRVNLIVGDVSTDGDGLSSTQILRKEILGHLGEQDGNANLSSYAEYLATENPHAFQAASGRHWTRLVADHKSLVRVLNSPWAQIYSVAGIDFSGIVFEGLKSSLSHVPADAAYPAENKGTLLIDERPAARDGVHAYWERRRYHASEREIWLSSLDAQISSTPSIAIATQAEDRLWDALSARHGGSNTGGSFPQPKCILIAEICTFEDRVKARRYNVDIVSASFKQFASWLQPGDQRLQAGFQSINRDRAAEEESHGVRSVAQLLKTPTPSLDKWDFLRGTTPPWSAVRQSLPIRREHLPNIRHYMENATESGTYAILSAAAGTGKTVILMSLAHQLEREGYRVAWISRHVQLPLEKLKDQVSALDPTHVFVDDADIFGDQAPRFLRQLSAQGSRAVIAAVRSSQTRVLGAVDSRFHFRGLDRLTDAEVKRLYYLLENAGLLGRMQGWAEEMRIRELRDICQGYLLAALLEIISGKPFESLVLDEYTGLSDDEQMAYALLCIYISYVNEAVDMRRQDLQEAMQQQGVDPTNAFRSILNCVNYKIIIESEEKLTPRHRAIAKCLVDQLDSEIKARSMQALLRFYALRASSSRDRSDPFRRSMISLLNHSSMRRFGLSASRGLAIYSSVQDILKDDFHFWLQRGAFAASVSEYELALSYLKSARSVEGGSTDHKVLNEWGMLHLRLALDHPNDSSRDNDARNVLPDLIEMARQKRAQSPHTFKVLAQHGYQFINTSNFMDDITRANWFRDLDNIVSIGLGCCIDNGEAMDELLSYAKRRPHVSSSQNTGIQSAPGAIQNNPPKPSQSLFRQRF